MRIPHFTLATPRRPSIPVCSTIRPWRLTVSGRARLCLGRANCAWFCACCRPVDGAYRGALVNLDSGSGSNIDLITFAEWQGTRLGAERPRVLGKPEGNSLSLWR